jgi:hypothetical protein
MEKERLTKVVMSPTRRWAGVGGCVMVVHGGAKVVVA